jgi:hypothetical protein
MKRVALLVTGKTEEALHQSLKRVFPEVEFVMLPRRDGFTSGPLPPTPRFLARDRAPRLTNARDRAPRPTDVERLAAALVAEVEPGRDQKPPDLVVLVDDLEIANQDWPARAVQHVRAAVNKHLEQHPWPSAISRERAYERVRERCSFHLLAPMVEAYFFREPAALTRAGAKRAPLFDASAADVETSFLVNDPDFLAVPDRPAREKLPPWATADRARHPKRYLQFLCDPTGKEARAYVETAGGQAALRDLDWPAVLAPQEHVRFMRSLIHDLADALGEDAVAQRFAGATHRLTWPPQRNRLLRNI